MHTGAHKIELYEVEKAALNQPLRNPGKGISHKNERAKSMTVYPRKKLWVATPGKCDLPFQTGEEIKK